MRRLITTGLAVLAAAAMMSACASGTGTNSAAAVAAIPMELSAAAPAGTPAGEWQRLIEDLYGTRGERRLAEAVQTANAQNAVRDCMAAQKMEYRPRPYEGIQGVSDMAVGDVAGVAPLREDFGIAAGKQRTSAAQAGYAAAGGNPAGEQDPENGPYTQAMNTCGNAGNKFDGTHWPAALLDLEGPLGEGVAKATQTPRYQELHAAYLTCMAGKGQPIKDWIDLYLKATEAFGPANPGDDRFAEGVAVERDAAAADVACRGPLYDYTTTELAPWVASFRTQNSAVLADLDKQWSAITEEAERLGIR